MYNPHEPQPNLLDLDCNALCLTRRVARASDSESRGRGLRDAGTSSRVVWEEKGPEVMGATARPTASPGRARSTTSRLGRAQSLSCPLGRRGGHRARATAHVHPRPTEGELLVVWGGVRILRRERITINGVGLAFGSIARAGHGGLGREQMGRGAGRSEGAEWSRVRLGFGLSENGMVFMWGRGGPVWCGTRVRTASYSPHTCAGFEGCRTTQTFGLGFRGSVVGNMP